MTAATQSTAVQATSDRANVRMTPVYAQPSGLGQVGQVGQVGHKFSRAGPQTRPPSGFRGCRSLSLDPPDRPYRVDVCGAAHDQFDASFRLPVPLYCAYCGYGQSGRDRLDCGLNPVICAGVTLFSRHASIVPIVSNVCGPSPPRQWPMPGTMNSRTKSPWSRPILASTLS